ncbi:hypothetical protein ACOSQ4_032968 [Xanthoceras sorbifolium]
MIPCPLMSSFCSCCSNLGRTRAAGVFSGQLTVATGAVGVLGSELLWGGLRCCWGDLVLGCPRAASASSIFSLGEVLFGCCWRAFGVELWRALVAVEWICISDWAGRIWCGLD